MKMNIYLIVCLLFVSIANAGYMGFNMSVQGNVDYKGVTDTPDQYSETHVQAIDSKVDMSYWMDYENPNIEINQYPVYNVQQVTKKTSNDEDIYKVVGEGMQFYIGQVDTIHQPDKIELWYFRVMDDFVTYIMHKVYTEFHKPVVQELEFYKRKIYYMEKDLNELRELMYQPEHDSYDCLALKSMMKDGLVERGDCSGQEWIADDSYIVSFQKG